MADRAEWLQLSDCMHAGADAMPGLGADARRGLSMVLSMNSSQGPASRANDDTERVRVPGSRSSDTR